MNAIADITTLKVAYGAMRIAFSALLKVVKTGDRIEGRFKFMTARKGIVSRMNGITRLICRVQDYEAEYRDRKSVVYDKWYRRYRQDKGPHTTVDA